VRKADNLTTLPPIVLKSGSFNLLEPSGPVMGLLYLYFLSSAHPCIHIQQCPHLYTIVSEAVGSSEVSEQIYQTTRRHILQYFIFNP